jgi:hypothetical protein
VGLLRGNPTGWFRALPFSHLPLQDLPVRPFFRRDKLLWLMLNEPMRMSESFLM